VRLFLVGSAPSVPDPRNFCRLQCFEPAAQLRDLEREIGPQVRGVLGRFLKVVDYFALVARCAPSGVTPALSAGATTGYAGTPPSHPG